MISVLLRSEELFKEQAILYLFIFFMADMPVCMFCLFVLSCSPSFLPDAYRTPSGSAVCI